MHCIRPKILLAEPDRFSPRALAALTEWAEVESRRPVGDSLRAAFEKSELFLTGKVRETWNAMTGYSSGGVLR